MVINNYYLLTIRMDLPNGRVIHLLRHDSAPYVLSHEVSSWLWEGDLLSFHLRRTKYPCTPLVLGREDAPLLYEALIESQSTVLWDALAMEQLRLHLLTE